jgi:hypothetical protein
MAVKEKIMSQIRELIESSDNEIIELLKRVDLGKDEKLQDAAYRELNRRYVSKAAERVIWAALITAGATVLVQLLGLIAT